MRLWPRRFHGGRQASSTQNDSRLFWLTCFCYVLLRIRDASGDRPTLDVDNLSGIEFGVWPFLTKGTAYVFCVSVSLLDHVVPCCASSHGELCRCWRSLPVWSLP